MMGSDRDEPIFLNFKNLIFKSNLELNTNILCLELAMNGLDDKDSRPAKLS